MAFIPIPDGIKVALEFTFGSRIIVVTLGYLKAGGPASGSDLVALNQDLQNWWSAHGAANFGAQGALSQIQSTDLTTVTGPQETLQVNPAIPGGQATESFQANVALVSTAYTDTRGRSFRGREFWGMIPITAQQDAQHVTQTYVNTVAGALALLENVGATSQIEQAVLSRHANKAPRNPGIATPVSSIVVRTRTDSQRRRLGGVSK